MDKHKSVFSLGLRTRVAQKLSAAGYNTVGDVQDFIADGGDPKSISGIGAKGASQIQAALAPTPAPATPTPATPASAAPNTGGNGMKTLAWVLGIGGIVMLLLCMLVSVALMGARILFLQPAVDIQALTCTGPMGYAQELAGNTSFTAGGPEVVVFFSGALGKGVTSLQAGQSLNLRYDGQINYVRYQYVPACAGEVSAWALTDAVNADGRTYYGLSALQNLLNDPATETEAPPEEEVEKEVVVVVPPPPISGGGFCPADQVTYHYPETERANIMAGADEALVVAMWVEETPYGLNKGQYVTWVAPGTSIDASAYSVVTVWTFEAGFDAESAARADNICHGEAPRAFVDPDSLR